MAQSSSKQRAEAEVLDLKGKLRQLNKAVASKGATIAENAPLVATIKAVEGLKAGSEEGVLTVPSSSYFAGWRSNNLPTLKLGDNIGESLDRFLAGNDLLSTLPEIKGLENVADMDSFCAYCSSLYSANLPALPKLNNFGSGFKDCSSLQSVVIGETPHLRYAGNLFSGCSALDTVTLDFSGGELSDLGEIFSGCGNLRTVAGTIDLTSIDYTQNRPFEGCHALEEVRIKGLNADLSLQDSEKLSVESVKYLVENLQQATGKSITLHQAWQTAHPNEAVEYSQKAAAKGFTLNFI